MISVGKTDVGKRRTINQDSVFCSDLPIGPLPNLYIVADGMGGHAAGDFASQYAIKVVVEMAQKSTVENPISLLKRAMIYASNEVYKASEKDKDKNGMGTTMVCAVVSGDTLYVSNIGDSRLYVINDEIRQITMDHSLVEELIRNGQLDRKKGRNHPEKNIITRAMGSREEAMPDFFEVKVKKGDRILLCSDGLSNMVADDEIRDIVGDDILDDFTNDSYVDNKMDSVGVSRESEFGIDFAADADKPGNMTSSTISKDKLEKIVDELINRANYYGGNDNVSALVVCI